MKPSEEFEWLLRVSNLTTSALLYAQPLMEPVVMPLGEIQDMVQARIRALGK